MTSPTSMPEDPLFNRVPGPALALEEEALEFVRSSTEMNATMPHQFGPVPISLQMLFGLVELTIHHDDIADAAGLRHVPGDIDVFRGRRVLLTRARQPNTCRGSQASGKTLATAAPQLPRR